MINLQALPMIQINHSKHLINTRTSFALIPVSLNIDTNLCFCAEILNYSESFPKLKKLNKCVQNYLRLFVKPIKYIPIFCSCKTGNCLSLGCYSYLILFLLASCKPKATTFLRQNIQIFQAEFTSWSSTPHTLVEARFKNVYTEKKLFLFFAELIKKSLLF